MSTLKDYTELAKEMQTCNSKVISYLVGKSTKFPLQPAQKILTFCAKGLLAHGDQYAQLRPLFEKNVGDEEGIRQLLSAEDNKLLSELSGAIFGEFDSDLERDSYWVASAYILQRQQEMQPDLCAEIEDTFRSVYVNGEHTLAEWLWAMIQEVVAA